MKRKVDNKIIIDLLYCGMFIEILHNLIICKDKEFMEDLINESKRIHSKFRNHLIKLNLDYYLIYGCFDSFDNFYKFLKNSLKDNKIPEMKERLKKIDSKIYVDLHDCFINNFNVYFNQSKKDALLYVKSELKNIRLRKKSNSIILPSEEKYIKNILNK